MSTQDEINRLCKQGQERLDAGAFGEASEAFAQALELDGRHPLALLGQASSLRQLKRYQDAQRVLNRAIFVYPSDARLLNEQGLLHLDQSRYEKALEYFERALVIAPNDKDILEWKVKSLRARGAPFDEAQKAVADALAQFPAEPAFLAERAWLYYDQKRYDEAVEAFLDWGNIDPIRAKIKSLIEERRFGEAEQLIEAALSRLPKDVGILIGRGLLYYEQEFYEKAAEAFHHALEVDPQNEKALFAKIDCLRLLGPPFDRAEKAVEEALATLPGNAKVLTARARLYSDRKQYDLAVDAYLGANQLNVLEEDIDSLRLSLSFDDAAELIEAALARLPKSVMLLNQRGWLYLDHNQFDRAAQAFQQTLDVEADNQQAWEGKTKSLSSQGPPFEAAERVISEALVKFPGHHGFLTKRALLFCQKKQYDKAVEAFIEADNQLGIEYEIANLRETRQFVECDLLIQAALNRLPHNVEVLRIQGERHLDLKEYRKATESFSRLLTVKPDDEYALTNKSFSLRAERLFTEAEATVQEGLGRFPKSVTLFNEQGWVYYFQSQHEQAALAFDRALEVDHANVRALQWKIRAVRATGDLADTEKAIEEAEKMAATSAEVVYERGKLHYDRDEYEKAADCYSKAIAIDSDYLEPYYGRVDALIQLNRSEDALDVLKALKQSRPDDADVKNQLGWFYLGRNDLSNARKEFEEIIARDPSSRDGINGIGAIYFSQGHYERAEEEFRRVLRDDPNNAALHGNLAWALVRQARESTSFPAEPRESTWLERLKRIATHSVVGDKRTTSDCLRKAEDHCTAALKIDPKYAEAYGCLGVIAFKRGRLIDSEDSFRRAVGLDSKGGSSYVDLAALYAQMGRYEEAEEGLKKACKLDRADARARVELGNVYLQTDRQKKATAMFREAMGVDPQSEEAARALAIALMRAGEYAEAGKVLRRAIRAMEEPKRWQLHLTLCQLLTDLGDKNSDLDFYEEALKEVLIATALKPDHPSPYFYAGIVRYKREEYALARGSFRKCLEKDPYHFEAEQNLRRVEAVFRNEVVRTQLVKVAGAALGVTCLALLLGLWVLYFRTDRITSTMVNTLSPILLGLVFVAFLLPWLSRLKLPGVEAEMSQPKEKISAGPTGSVGFGSSSLSSGPQ